MRMTKRRWIVVVVAIAAVAAAAWALVPKPLQVDVARVTRGPLEVSIAEDGITRIRERYVVAAPVAGRLLRVEVHAGDQVASNAALLRIDPAPLDPKQRAELTARLRAAEHAADEAAALLARTRDNAQRTRSEASRIRRLAANAIVSRDDLEAAQTNAAMAAKDEEAARFRAEATKHDVEVAHAALGEVGGSEVVVRAPVSGRVLQVMQESESVVAAGTPLVLVGDPASLEVVADFLSTDAVRIPRGASARIERWGGGPPLAARVRLVEPEAFTKVSALGVEEQRVNVICDLVDGTANLGDQYRVDVRVVLRSGEATKVPATALFTSGGKWQTFVVRDGRAHLQNVTTGSMSDTDVEIASGLALGDEVVVHPSDQIHDGVRVTARR